LCRGDSVRAEHAVCEPVLLGCAIWRLALDAAAVAGLARQPATAAGLGEAARLAAVRRRLAIAETSRSSLEAGLPPAARCSDAVLLLQRREGFLPGAVSRVAGRREARLPG